MNDDNQHRNASLNLVGLLPAGGTAQRIQPLPCSKELYPIGFHPVGRKLQLRPKTVSHYLLEKMQLASVTKAYFILRKGKWDIPAYFGDGSEPGVYLAYLIIGSSFGVPYTLDQAYPFIENATVVFGFPDILFEPDDAFVKLLERQSKSGADLVLGLFTAEQPQKMDMVDLDARGRIRRIVIKPERTELLYTWIIAVWNSTFTHFLHGFVASETERREKSRPSSPAADTKPKELFLGDVIQEAIQDGLKIDSVFFPRGSYVDIGTPEDLIKTCHSENFSRT